MASFLSTMTARQLVCWDKLSSSIFPWYLSCLPPATVSCLIADYKLSGTGTVLRQPTQGASSPLPSWDKRANRQCRWNNPPKDNPAWVTAASLGHLSWNCPFPTLITHWLRALTLRPEATGSFTPGSMSKSWKYTDRYVAFLMVT